MATKIQFGLLANDSVDNSTIKDSTVTASDLQSDPNDNTKRAVGTNHIQDSAVTSTKIVTGSVTADKLSTGGPSWDNNGTLSAKSIDLGSTGTITAGSLKKSGGTSTQYLMADGSTTSSGGALDPESSQQIKSLGVGTAASGTTGEIRATNDITAYYSDIRLKENINPIKDALAKVCSLRGVTYNANDVAANYGYSKEEQVGVIAQEVEAILPQIVKPAPFDINVDDDGNEYSRSGENYKTVKYEKLVPLLIEAIKELKEEINQLKRGN